ncbi:MAG: hypothetical protein AB1473_14555 [Thermodesulfobacteriota bacterium]
MRALLFSLLAVLIVVSQAQAEAVHGKVTSEGELDTQIRQWKYDVVKTAGRYKKKVTTEVKSKVYKESRKHYEDQPSWGYFLYCVNASDRSEIFYAYSYGENSPDNALNKARHALALCGDCYMKPKMLYYNSQPQ